MAFLSFANTTLKFSNAARGTSRFVVCIHNHRFEASLERNKIYAVLPDAEAVRQGDGRVAGERARDDLLSTRRFVPVEAPAAVRASLVNASRQ